MRSANYSAKGRFMLGILAATCTGSSSMALASETDISILRSAPAFTVFVADFIHEAMPRAKVSVTGPLRLDVEMPNGGHTVYLDNIHSACVRNPKDCIAEITTFVAAALELYKEGDMTHTRDALRIVVRPSALVAEIRAASRRNKPLAAPLAGDYWVIAVFDAPTTIEFADEADLVPLKLTPNEALAVALDNTRRALRQSVQEELAKNPCKGILGGDLYVASALAFPELWAIAAKRCHDDLLVAAPASDVLVYIDGTTDGALKSIVRVADDVMARDEKPFSDTVFRWTANGWARMTPPVRSTR
jgi:uncharacterized protein YtpQ (UPF0354 family)